MRLLHTVLTGLFSLTLAFSAFAQGTIDLRIEAQKEVEVTTDDGQVEFRLVPAARMVPGDEVVYTIFFKNIGDLPATDIVIDDPIPAETYLKEGSVFGSGTEVTYSIDGGKTFKKPGELAVVENGEIRQARPDEYTTIRWVFRETLDPGAEGIVGFRAILR